MIISIKMMRRIVLVKNLWKPYKAASDTRRGNRPLLRRSTPGHHHGLDGGDGDDDDGDHDGDHDDVDDDDVGDGDRSS